jgi:putative oxidoreductase
MTMTDDTVEPFRHAERSFPTGPGQTRLRIDASFGAATARDSLLLASRVLLMLLFVIFGWEKLFAYAATVRNFALIGVPMPILATFIAVVTELVVGVALMIGLLTRPLAIVLAIYTFATALLGHHYWTMTGMQRIEGEIGFFKNVSIVAGLLLLYVSGAGKYSLDARIKLT